MTERARFWAEQLAAWAQSGLSQAEFCRQRELKGGTFAWWKRQLQTRDGGRSTRRRRTAKSPARFVEVRLPGACSGTAYEVMLARGRSIRVPSAFDPQVLSRLITAVESC